MTIVLSVLLVVCLVAIAHLLRGWHWEYQRAEELQHSLEAEVEGSNELYEKFRKSKAECVGLSDQVAGLTNEKNRLSEDVSLLQGWRESDRSHIRKLENQLEAVRVALASDPETTE